MHIHTVKCSGHIHWQEPTESSTCTDGVERAGSAWEIRFRRHRTQHWMEAAHITSGTASIFFQLGGRPSTLRNENDKDGLLRITTQVEWTTCWAMATVPVPLSHPSPKVIFFKVGTKIKLCFPPAPRKKKKKTHPPWTLGGAYKTISDAKSPNNLWPYKLLSWLPYLKTLLGRDLGRAPCWWRLASAVRWWKSFASRDPARGAWAFCTALRNERNLSSSSSEGSAVDRAWSNRTVVRHVCEGGGVYFKSIQIRELWKSLPFTERIKKCCVSVFVTQPE